MNEQLLRATYGTEAQSILDAAQSVADAKTLGVSGAIIPVEGTFQGGHEVENAYKARFADPCNPLRSNDVVRAIGKVIDSYTAARPGIRNIVIIGDDRQIPMANIVDDTNFANERTFAQDFSGNNESISALLAGMYRTDDPYGTTAGISVRNHELFVPERAVGRLVETPTEIIQSLTNFTKYNGRLDPSTTQNTALETGYEFLSDGAELNAKNLEAGGYNSVVRLINNAWTDGALAAALGAFPTNPAKFDVIGLHGHFDQNNALPALNSSTKPAPSDPDTQAGFGVGTDPLFSSNEFPAAQNRAVVYSMGCHAGYSLSDIEVGSQSPDWAQRLVGGIGNVFAGNTGFGYGDSDIVALSESLTAQFATEVAQSGSIGQAWVDAKQQHVSKVHVLDAYQEKVLEEFVFYGLPMFYVGATPPPVAAPVAPTTVPPSNLPDAGFGGLKVATVVATPNFTGTATAPNPVVTPSGSFYTVGGQTLDVNGRPIQPLFTSDITRPGLVARDTLITGLSSRDVGNFDPVFFKASTELRSAATRISRRFVPGGAGVRAQLQGRRQGPAAAPARRRPVPRLRRRSHPGNAATGRPAPAHACRDADLLRPLEPHRHHGPVDRPEPRLRRRRRGLLRGVSVRRRRQRRAGLHPVPRHDGYDLDGSRPHEGPRRRVARRTRVHR